MGVYLEPRLEHPRRTAFEKKEVFDSFGTGHSIFWTCHACLQRFTITYVGTFVGSHILETYLYTTERFKSNPQQYPTAPACTTSVASTTTVVTTMPYHHENHLNRNNNTTTGRHTTTTSITPQNRQCQWQRIRPSNEHCEHSDALKANTKPASNEQRTTENGEQSMTTTDDGRRTTERRTTNDNERTNDDNDAAIPSSVSETSE